MTQWGPPGTSSDHESPFGWINSGQGIDSVDCADVTFAENQPAPHGLATTAGLYHIGSGTRCARGMVDNNVPAWGGGFSDTIYNTFGAFLPIGTASVHNVEPNSTTVTAKWKVKFRGEVPLSPNYEDPLDNGTIGSFRRSAVPDPDAGSDSIGLWLDSARDYLPQTGVGISTNNFSADPLLSGFHANHSIVWPFRVRMDRTQRFNAGNDLRLGFVPPGRTGANWDVLCEARIFQFTSFGGLTQFLIYLVWYPDNFADIVAGQNEAYIMSRDSILLAAYSGGVVPTNLESPFFHYDQSSVFPLWDLVECEIYATLNGAVALTCRSLDRAFEQTISISGEAAVESGTLDANTTPVGLTFVDIGCAFSSTRRYTDLGASYYPNEKSVDIGQFFTWSQDEIEGEDIVLGATSSSTIYNQNFAGLMDATAILEPQTCSLMAYPKTKDDVLFMVQESKFQSVEASGVQTNVRNSYSTEASGYAENAPTTSLESSPIDPIDLDGAEGGDWNFRENSFAGFEIIKGGDLALYRISPTAFAGSLFESTFPSDQANAHKLWFNVQGSGSPFAGNVKVRFRNSASPNSSFDFPSKLGTAVAAPPLYDYWVRIPHMRNPGTDWTVSPPGVVRTRQCEVALFTDNVLKTDPGVSEGLGEPPNGIGIRLRSGPGTTLNALEFFVQGTSVDTIHTLRVSGVSLNAIPLSPDRIHDLVLASEDDGLGNISFKLWIMGHRIFTDSAGTADHIVTKANIISAGLMHGIGIQFASGGTGGGAVPFLMGTWVSGHGLACGFTKYQGRFHYRFDEANGKRNIREILVTTGASGYSDDGYHVDFDSVAGNNLAAGPGDNASYTFHMHKPRARVTNFPGFRHGNHTKYISVVDTVNGGTFSNPWPNADLNGPLKITSVMMTRLDGEVAAGSNQHTDLIIYRGLSLRSKANQWFDMANTGGTPFQVIRHGVTGGGAVVGLGPNFPKMHLATGANLLLFGNPSTNLTDAADTVVTYLRMQVIVVTNTGTRFVSPLVQLSGPGFILDGAPAFQYNLKLELEETIDTLTLDRNFIARAYRQLSDGGAFDPVPIGESTFAAPFTDATWTSFAMGNETCLYRTIAGWADNTDRTYYVSTGSQHTNTTWFTEVNISAFSTSGSAQTTFDSSVTASIPTSESSILNVRGAVEAPNEIHITGVRGKIVGDVQDPSDLVLSRRLLVFERDELGYVPGSLLSSNQVSNWYKMGYIVDPDFVWGEPKFNYDEALLAIHQLRPSTISHPASGVSSMTLVQDNIRFSGGHLRPGQLVVYIEHVAGRPYEIDTSTGMLYGGNGVKILFRGEVTGATRNRIDSNIIYEAQGPEYILQSLDILDLSDCAVGQIAYNVEPGSIHIPYAVSKNLEFTDTHTPQFSPDNFGSRLGLGIPDLVGMTLVDIIEHFLNKFKDRLNGAGVLRLTDAGDFTVANLDHSNVVLGPKSTLTAANIAPNGANFPNWGPHNNASLVWSPNRDAFNFIPPETVIQGKVLDIIRGLLAAVPDVRLSIEPDTLRWVIETRKSTRGFTVNTSIPGVEIDIKDDSSNCFTAALVGSPWRQETKFTASLKDGSIKPAWLDGVDIESDWSGPFRQIGSFTGEVTSVQNFPFMFIGESPPGPKQTIMVIKVFVGDEPLPVGSFNGVTVKFLDGPAKGHTGKVDNSGQHGGLPGDFQFFDVVFHPPLPGGYGLAVVDVTGSEVLITDDPAEPTTANASAWRRTWADYIILDPDSGRVVNNLAPGGSFGINEVIPGCPTGLPAHAASFRLPANSVIKDGQLVTSPFPLASAESACQAGNSLIATACGGDIIYDAVRIEEGTWCVRAPEEGFTGTAYRDIVEYDGILDRPHTDGLGFDDFNVNWKPGQWEPSGGSFATVLLVGGYNLAFQLFTASSTSDINAGYGFNMVGGWGNGTNQFLEERSLDASDDVLEFNGSSRLVWRNQGSGLGRTRGSFVTRCIPARPVGPHDFTPLSLGSSTDPSSLNNNFAVEVSLVLGATDPVTSLSQVGIIMRAENGFVENRIVPQNDQGAGIPYFNDAAISVNPTTGLIADPPDPGGFTFQRGVCAEAATKIGQHAPLLLSQRYDIIPTWISSTGSPDHFRESQTPTGGFYNGQNVLGSDGIVLDSRNPNNPVEISSTSRYTSPSSTFSVADKALKKGLEYGTTGYVFRYVRGDEPDYLFGSEQASARDRCYPTFFWYHTRVAVDGAGLPVLDSSGEPVFQGVKEIIWQSPHPVTTTDFNEHNGGAGEALILRFSVETSVPNGKSNKLFASLFGIYVDDGAGGRVRKPSTLIRDHYPNVFESGNPNLPWSFLANTFDGTYADQSQGFSMSRGAGGFGYGLCKCVMTDSGPGDFSVDTPAETVSWRLQRINKPAYNFGPGGISVQQFLDNIENELATAKVGRVIFSGNNSIRFELDASAAQDPGYTPAIGDKYKLIIDRGWGIARMRTREQEGLDDPLKVWIFRHIADSMLEEGKDKKYTGRVTLPGIAHEAVGTVMRLSLSADDGYTGMEAAQQIVDNTLFEFFPERKTTLNLTNDGRGLFSKVEELLNKEARNAAVNQKPYWLGPDFALNTGKSSQLANSGIDTTSQPGFGGQAPKICSDNVIFADPDSPSAIAKSLTNQFLALREELYRIMVLVDANKDGIPTTGGDLNLESPSVSNAGLTSFGLTQGRVTNKLVRSGLFSEILSMMKARGISFGSLIFDDFAYRDETDGEFYSIKAVGGPSGADVRFVWTAVERDTERVGRFKLKDQSHLQSATRPRESGKAVLSIAGGESAYTIVSDFKWPVVTLYAATGYSGPVSVQDGEELNTDNLPGLSIVISPAEPNIITVSAGTTPFGPFIAILSA
jgi:hypothetical protein